MRTFILRCMAGCLALAGSAAWAGDEPLVMTSAAGKTVCRSATASVAERQAEMELCVISANFAHDIYLLRIGGETLFKGIDDETTHGLIGKWHEQPIALVCTPRTESPKDVSEEKIAAFQKVMPNTSRDEARMLALAAESVEVGRQCVVKSTGSQVLMQVQVYSPR